jgi:mRNA-degrading endonuclease toxin of MazEF toxin-antitoxin module
MTRKPIVIFNHFEVVVVPFPFTDKAKTKRRPALILSSAKTFNQPAGHSVMAMITSARNAPWPLDVTITDLAKSGLPAPSVVRMKLFTLDHRLVLSTIGVLSPEDQQAVRKTLSRLLHDA